MDMQALTPEENQNFIIALNNLKQAIEDTLAAAIAIQFFLTPR